MVCNIICLIAAKLSMSVSEGTMQKAYSYEAIKIELLDYMKKENRVVDGQNRATETAPRISTNSISVAKLLNNVERSYHLGEKNKFLQRNLDKTCKNPTFASYFMHQ